MVWPSDVLILHATVHYPRLCESLQLGRQATLNYGTLLGLTQTMFHVSQTFSHNSH